MSSPHDVPLIRDAVPDDAPQIAPLLDQLGFPSDAATIAERLRRLHEAGETALVGVLGETVIGVMTIHVTPVLHRPTAVGRITALVVDEAHRSRGVGRALVAEAEQRLAALGCGLFEVTSNHKHVRAHAFYERLGYAITSHRFGKTMSPAS